MSHTTMCQNCNGSGEIDPCDHPEYEFQAICNDEELTIPCEEDSCDCGKVECTAETPDATRHHKCTDGHIPCFTCYGAGTFTGSRNGATIRCPDCWDSELEDKFTYTGNFWPAKYPKQYREYFDKVMRSADKLPADGRQECPECEGDGTVECESCSGVGYHRRTCDRCGEELETDYHATGAYISDCELFCSSCANELASTCPICGGSGEVPHKSVTLLDDNGNQRTYATASASCSCCGANPHKHTDTTRDRLFNRTEEYGYSWHTYQANMLDTDGVFFSYLCGDNEGEQGCLREVHEQQSEVKAKLPDRAMKCEVISEVLDGDNDGIWAEMSED